MKNFCRFSVFPFLFMSLLMQSDVMAADKEAMARAQYMIRQITAEKNQLAAENKKLLVAMKELEKKYETQEKCGFYFDNENCPDFKEEGAPKP